MKKILIYPYNNDAKWLLMNQKLLKNIEIVGILMNQINDADQETKNKFPHIKFFTDFKAAEFEYDYMLMCENIQNFNLDFYYEVYKCVKSAKKKVILSINLLKDLKNKYAINDSFIETIESKWNNKSFKSDTCEDIEVPVVTIMGMGRNCDKFSTAIALNEYAKAKGYNTLCLVSNYCGKFIDVKILPEFLFDDNICLPNKILMFNHYLAQIVEKESPDLVILECPGGIMPINEYEHNFFAEVTFAITNAVITDVAILNSYFYEKANEDFFNGLIEICKNKFNVSVEAFGICGQQYRQGYGTKKITYRFMQPDYETLYKNIKNVDIFAVSDIEKRELIFDKAIKSLENNIETI